MSVRDVDDIPQLASGREGGQQEVDIVTVRFYHSVTSINEVVDVSATGSTRGFSSY
jgi:hypothetical protein